MIHGGWLRLRHRVVLVLVLVLVIVLVLWRFHGSPLLLEMVVVNQRQRTVYPADATAARTISGIAVPATVKIEVDPATKETATESAPATARTDCSTV